jgi:CheY-like chemotaxis protein
MTDRQYTPQHHAYILRFWETRSLPPDPPTTWRFSLEDLRTEEEHKFPDLKSLTTFLHTRVGGAGSNHGDQGPGNGAGKGESGAETGPQGVIEASILLVEEDAAIRGSVRRWLEKVLPGCRVSEAGSDDEAVALARSESPEVILVDVAPPKKGGLETVRSLRASAPAAEIVALTMERGQADRDEALLAGASTSLAIWRIREELVPALRDVLDAKRAKMEGKTVVCIEDEPDIIDLIQFALARHGVNLVGVLGGREGLDAIRRVQPDLVLLDLMMPDVDGWQVYQRMKADERMRDIPVIVITVLDPYWSAKQGLDLTGVDGYVTKPFVPQELAERVSTALRVVA